MQVLDIGAAVSPDYLALKEVRPVAHEIERVCGAREILSVAIFWKVNMCAHFAGCAVPRGAAGTAGWAGLVSEFGRRRLGLQAGHD